MITEQNQARLLALCSNSKAEVIAALWEQCEADFLAICNQAETPEGVSTIIEQMVSYRYSQLNADGLNSQSFSGMSENYLTDYPDRLKRAMYRYRRMKVL